ncbi:MAG: hypothetical protein JNK76_12730 [Planctomycetales bacterium]|nr:hypothetical protein [Planctomycetales bacterium]
MRSSLRFGSSSVFALLATLAIAAPAGAAEARRPNIILILADDKCECLTEKTIVGQEFTRFPAKSTSDLNHVGLQSTEGGSLDLTTHCYSRSAAGLAASRTVRSETAGSRKPDRRNGHEERRSCRVGRRNEIDYIASDESFTGDWPAGSKVATKTVVHMGIATSRTRGVVIDSTTSKD